MHSVTGKLNKAASEFAAGEYTGFNVRVGERFYNRESKTNDWTNYSAVIFSNNQSQIQFLRDNLIEGAIVELSGEQIKIDTFTKDNGEQLITLELVNAKLGYISAMSAGGVRQPQQQSQQPQQAQQAQQMPDRQGKDRVWTHAELLAKGATLEQINKMPIVEDIPF
jgi:single-strand DNA-binding protein